MMTQPTKVLHCLLVALFLKISQLKLNQEALKLPIDLGTQLSQTADLRRNCPYFSDTAQRELLPSHCCDPAAPARPLFDMLYCCAKGNGDGGGARLHYCTNVSCCLQGFCDTLPNVDPAVPIVLWASSQIQVCIFKSFFHGVHGWRHM